MQNVRKYVKNSTRKGEKRKRKSATYFLKKIDNSLRHRMMIAEVKYVREKERSKKNPLFKRI